MNTKSNRQSEISTTVSLFLTMMLGLLFPELVQGATGETLYQTSFEPPAFTPGLPIRGQDGWEMFHNGQAISVSISNPNTGAQCLRMDGAQLEPVGQNLAAAYCFSRVFLDSPPSNPPVIVEITASVRLDGPQTGTNGAPDDDLMSANFGAYAAAGGQGVLLGQFLVSSAGRIFTIGSQPEDRYKFSAPMTFGAYHKLGLRADFNTRTLRYLVDDAELGSVVFSSSITTDQFASGYLTMAGPIQPLTTPYVYNPSNYTAYFDDYRIASIPLPPNTAEIVVEQPAGASLISRLASVDFGGSLVGARSTRTFTIRNRGNIDLTGLRVGIDGSQAAEFAVTASPSPTINPGGSTTFTLTFMPAAAGIRTASLHIASNDGDENPFDIALTGIGLTPTDVAQQAYLKASNTGAGQWFGESVAVSGETVIVGAPNEFSNATGVNGNQSDTSASGSGAAYVFVRSGTIWMQQAYLKASNTGANDLFGFSVAISDDTVVIGAPFEDSSTTGVNGNQANNSAADSGAVYVFVRNGTNWTQQAYLKASNTGAEDYFGYRVALSGDTLVVASPYEDSNATGVNGNQSNNSASTSGAAYVFVRSGTNWSQQAYLKASNTGPDDYFAVGVGVSGDTVVVGAPGEDSNATGVNGNQASNSATSSGAAYVFVRTGTNWTQQAYLKASNTGVGDEFGWSVAVSADTVVIGAHLESSIATGVNGNQSDNSAGGSGAAYVFVRTGTNWSQQAYLKASNTEGASPQQGSGDEFGASVAVSGDIVVVAAGYEASNATGVNGDQSDNSALRSGAVYVFVRTGTNWSQQAYLKGSNTESGDFFGGGPDYNGVAVSGHTVVVGAFNESSNATGVNGDQANNSAGGSGAAYVFTGLGRPNGPSIVIQPVPANVLTGSSATFTVSATTTNPPLRYQWRFNGADLPGATGPTLTIPNAQIANVGNYQVVVADSVGSVASRTANLGLIDALFITGQPVDLAVRAGSNATFFVAVYGTEPLRYQWRFNGLEVSNATNSTLLLTNVQPAQLGDYRVVIANPYGAVTSVVATLTFLTPPTITQPPQPVTATAGENATFTVTVTNTATLPITYQWRKLSTILTNIVLYSRACSFTLYNVQTNATATNGPGSYRVVALNAANPSPGLASGLVTLTVLPAVQRPAISGYTRLANGVFQLRFSGTAGVGYTVLGSTNLTDWVALGAATETAPGQFEFVDTDAPGQLTRFYRLRSP